jgi:hypothetical protein
MSMSITPLQLFGSERSPLFRTGTHWLQYFIHTLLMNRITKEEVIDMFVDMSQIERGHGFECLRWDPGEVRCFGILDFCHSFAEFFPADRIVELP